MEHSAACELGGLEEEALADEQPAQRAGGVERVPLG